MDTDGLAERNERGDFETAVTKRDTLALRVWLRLLTCTNLFEQNVRGRLRAEYATTLPRFDILAQLDRASNGLTMGELSRRLMVSNGNVTGLVDRLVGEGLVERRPAPNDRRAQVVRLTGQGRRVFGVMAPSHQDWVRDLLSDLSEAEQQALYDLLAKLKASLARSPAAAKLSKKDA